MKGADPTMRYFICPICGGELRKRENSFVCAENHCFDRSRKGFLNLLLSRKKRHGDDRRMVLARRDFLEKGYYLPLLNALIRQVENAAFDGCAILDCGCGECWYTDRIYEALKSEGKSVDFFGIDVSKEAISLGASRNRALKLAVASVYDIPLPDHSCDVILSLFAPFSPKEYDRLLKSGGALILAFPMQEHLWELKQAVYDRPYKNEVADLNIRGYDLIESKIVHDRITLCTHEDILSLFSMTPYFYKTSREDQEKLTRLNRLETQIHFCAAAYRKSETPGRLT